MGTVVVRVAEASDDRLKAQVMDDGAGADVDELKRLIAADRAPGITGSRGGREASASGSLVAWSGRRAES